uniref:Lactase n=1 Tax=Scleropages formosus TaxID=113540 RepID=A0A8C9S1Z6_SCLFO
LACLLDHGFQWSTSSEAFKVEGGWAEHGKGETIWDRFTHSGQAFANQTGDLACDSYNKVDYDAYLLRGLLVTTYQFSISWARVFPSGRRGSLSEKGARYYDRLIDALSLMDGFEGPQGYSERFGLHYVNFEDPNRPRTPKASAYFYSKVIENNGFVAHLRHPIRCPLYLLSSAGLSVFASWYGEAAALNPASSCGTLEQGTYPELLQ